MNKEELLEALGQPGIRVGILLLEQELPHLGTQEDGWMNNHLTPVYIGRLSAEEFKEMDVGRHPKTLIFKDGLECCSFDGVPDYKTFRELVVKCEQKI